MKHQMTDFDFRKLVPDSIASDAVMDGAGQSINTWLAKTQALLDQVLIYDRLESLSDDVLNLLAWQYNVDFYSADLPEDQKRNMIRNSIAWHKKKGTAWAVRTALANFGYEAEIIPFREWADKLSAVAPPIPRVDGKWDLDDGQILAVPSALIGLPMMHHWAQFIVKLNLGAMTRKGSGEEVRAIVDEAKNVRSWPVYYFWLCWEMIVSALDVESSGHVVNETKMQGLPCCIQLDGTWQVQPDHKALLVNGAWCLDGRYTVDGYLPTIVSCVPIYDCHMYSFGSGKATSIVPAGDPEADTKPDFTLALAELELPLRVDGTWVVEAGNERLPTTFDLTTSRSLDGTWLLPPGQKLGGLFAVDDTWLLDRPEQDPARQGKYLLDGKRYVGPPPCQCDTWPQVKVDFSVGRLDTN